MSKTPIKTSFVTIYDAFFARVTDDMYCEMTEIDTIRALQDILINAIPRFEFPRFDIFDYEEGYWTDLENGYCGIESNNQQVPATAWVGGAFNCLLSQEEINILALNMVIEWLIQQLDTTENSKLKFSGSDFKFASQANHMAKLKNLIEEQKTDSIHLQRIYKRRRFTNNGSQSTLGDIVSKPSYGVGNINRVGTWGSRYGI